jgi:hypothetical protein
MKGILLLSVLTLFTSNAFSQTTYLVDTAMTTDTGYNGGPASCIYTGGHYSGFWMDRDKNYKLADEFTVPFATTWTFDTVVLYGFQYGGTNTSPFTGAYLQIYQGVPGAGGTVIWGDTSTNILSTTGFTGIYRVDTTDLASTSLPIMYLKLHLSPAPSLSAGTYWLCWSTDGSAPGRMNCPPKTLPGRLDPTGQVARQDSSGHWYTLADNSHHLGFNKIIVASADLSVHEMQDPIGSCFNQISPNPANSRTTISVHLDQRSHISLTIYNAIGQQINKLVDDTLSKGDHDIEFATTKLPSGIYYCFLQTNGEKQCKPIQVLH